MRTKFLSFILAALLTAAACTTEDYYRSANLSPELTASVDLDMVDTIKTSAISSQRTYTMSVSGADENLNMNMLLVSAPTGSVKIDGVASNSLAIETAKERSKFTHGVEFTPNSDGLHTITARVTDDFGNFNSVEKQVYSFTNMRPKVGVTYTTQRIYPDGVEYAFDFITSYDRDAKWGGKVDTFFIKYYSQNVHTDYGEEYAWGYTSKSFVDYAQTFSELLPDDGLNWFTDIWCWVKDNEGAVSDTVHFNIGHVE